MPKELIETPNLINAILRYRSEIGREPYQQLSSLLNKLKTLCSSNSSISLVLPSLPPKLISTE